LRFTPASGADAIAVDEAVVRRLVEACHTIEGHLVKPARLSALDLLNWPGVVQQPEPDH
jgi:uncharacterized protein YicC (UPF0701 family)